MSREDTGFFQPGIEIERANLANLFRQTPEMVCILAGPEHRFEFVNEAHVRVLGFNATGMTMYEAQPESVEVHGILDDVFRSGKTAALVEIPVTLTGQLRYFNLTYAARKNGRDQVDGIMILGSEVTETVLARKAQENQRRWLESVLDRLPIPVFFIDPKSEKVTFDNSAAREMMDLPSRGTTVAERQNQGQIRVFQNGREVGPDRVPSARAIRRENLRDENYVIESPRGRFEVVASTAFFQEEFGHPETALLLLQDVTPMRQITSALQRSEEQLSSALKVSKVGFYDWDIVNEVASLSPRMLEDWGFPENMGTMKIEIPIARIHPEDRPRVDFAIQSAVAKRENFATEYRVVHPSGKVVWIEARGSVHYDGTNVPVRFFGTSINVTERRRTEETLRESEQGLRRLADSMPQIVWTATPDGDLEYTNRRWTEYSGSSDSAKWAEAVHPDDFARVMPIWVDSVTTGKPYETEFRLRGLDGTYRWFLVRAVAMLSRGGEVAQWLGTCTDIEEQKLGETALRAANIAAESANAAKSAFLANMSHEIRTPLGAIMGFVGLMKNPKVSSYNLASYVSVIERNSDHLLRIVDDILDLSKVEAGQMQIERIEFSLPEILADVASLFGFRAREKAIEFELHALTELPLRVISDPTRIRQVLTNVLGNAIKFTDRGSIRISVSYAEQDLRFTVKDSGLGISADQRAILFQPFAQADASTTRKFGGTGLGLVLTRRLCEALGGTFALIATAPGEGSTFEASMRIDIPVSTEMVPARSVRFDSAPTDRLNFSPRLAGSRVLIVEDSPDNQVLFRVMLEEAGAEVVLAGDGLQGVEAARASAFDAIVMDIQMPRMDGHAAARKLRNEGFSGPLIALTAHAMSEERERCRRSGFSDFLSKPVLSGSLVETIHAALRPPLALKIPEIEVLFVEDDADIRDSVTELLSLEGISITGVSSAEEGIAAVERITGPLLIVTDLSLPGMSGEDFVRHLGEREDRHRFRVVIASGWSDLPKLARELGADGSLAKPFDTTRFMEVVQRYGETLTRKS